MKKKLSIRDLFALKGKRQLTMTTAYDIFTAKACETAGIDIVVTSGAFLMEYIEGELVRRDDSLDYLEIALKGVRKGAPNTFLYCGLPYGHCKISAEEAKRNAMEAMRWGADAVYFSGMSLDTIRELSDNKIPVVGHVGLVPWHAYWEGGFRAHGKSADEAIGIYEDTLAQQDAGVIGVEIECVPARVAEEIAGRVEIPVISMGSGNRCDGQYLFSGDILGYHDNKYPRHAVKYRDYFNDKAKALGEFVKDVHDDTITKKQKLLDIDDGEFEKFMTRLERKQI